MIQFHKCFHNGCFHNEKPCTIEFHRLMEYFNSLSISMIWILGNSHKVSVCTKFQVHCAVSTALFRGFLII